MWYVIAIGSALAGISQLLKIYILSESDSKLPSRTRLLAYTFSGAIGYFSWIQIIMNFWPEFATTELMLGSAGVIGWVGGDINLAIGRMIQERLGIPLGIPMTRDEDKTIVVEVASEEEVSADGAKVVVAQEEG